MARADYDLVIAGGGPAGLTAGLYAARAKLKTLLIEKMVIGGQAASTFLIENYPGFPDGISGQELAQAMESQAKRVKDQRSVSEFMCQKNSGMPGLGPA